MATTRKSFGWNAFVNENAMFLVIGAFVLILGGYALLTPNPPTIKPELQPQTNGAATETDIKPVIRIGDTVYAPSRVYITAIQPTTLPSDGGGGWFNIKGAYIVAGPDGGVIGGTPSDAPPDVIPAPILIEDSIIDKRIKLGPNVVIGENVYYYP